MHDLQRRLRPAGVQPERACVERSLRVAIQAGNNCWCTYNAEHPSEPAPYKCERCHSFVREGQIQFLTDCTHNLAGSGCSNPNKFIAGELNCSANREASTAISRVATPYS